MSIRPAVALLTAGLLATFFSSLSLAQVSPSQGGYYPPPVYPRFPGGGGGGRYGGFGGYGGGGTAAGSYLNGMANVVRSAGYYNVMNSVAAQNWEHAYSYDLDNRLKATNTYFEMRRVNAAAKAESRPPAASAEDLARYASVMAPKRLTSSELDPVTGEINWPGLLNDQRYAKLRENVDQLFTQRQATSGGSSDYRATVNAIEALRAALLKNIDDYSPGAYIEARKFLDSLQYEARFVTS
ncbi:MAG TPA: hypothetical protein VHY91_00600 [Pirellulales bacterium]|jgi:hypothetical protein|nr:hypothetical protein [Pirellulales bacterium]